MDSSDEEEVFITCEVCDLPFTGIEPFEQHIKGKKHKKQIKKRERRFREKSPEEAEDAEAYCDICGTSFTGIIPYAQHLRSKPHAKALRRKKVEEDPTKDDNVNSDSELPDDDADLNDRLKEIVPESFGSCTLCEKQFSGPESYSQHMKSKSHSNRKAGLQLLRKIRAELNKNKDLAEICEEFCKDKPSQDKLKDFAPAEEDEELECKDCHKFFTGPISFAQHMTSKTHAKRQHQNKLLEELKNTKALEPEDSASEDQQTGEGEDGVDPVLTCDICGMAFSGPESAKAHLKSKGHQKAIKWKRYLARRSPEKPSLKRGDNQQDVESKSGVLVASTDDDEAKQKYLPAGTGSTVDAVYSEEVSAPALPDYDDECPPYRQNQEGENFDHENPKNLSYADENSKMTFLYPLLPDDDNQSENKNAPSANLADSESDSSVSESVKPEEKESVKKSEDEESLEQSEDENVPECSKDAADDDSSSCDTYSGKKRKSKTAKCKSGVGKLVTTVAKIFD